MALGQRVKEIRERREISQSYLADQVGMTQSAVGALEKRDSAHSRKVYQIAQALGVSAEWLMFGGDVHEAASKYMESGDTVADAADRMMDDKADELKFIGHMDVWDSNTPLDHDEIELPLFREVELAAGAGQTQVQENDGAKLRFAKSTLSRANIAPENAACAFVTGNSMEPVMPDGTTVGVNTADTGIRDGEIYALDHDGMLRVKFLYRKPGGGLMIRSQNQDEHPDEHYTVQAIHDQNIRVIGRVFWWSVLR